MKVFYLIHYENTVTEMFSLVQIMRCHNNSPSHSQDFNCLPDGLSCFRIDRTAWFVQNH